VAGVRILPVGDQGVVVELGDRIDPGLNARVRWLAREVTARLGGEVLEVVPTYRSLLVLHDPLRVPRDRLVEELERLAAALPPEAAPEAPARTVHLPACYGGEHGPDLEFVARHAGLTPDEAVALHAGATYLVYMLGFTPGFGYFGGMPPRLATPRLDTPRPRVAAGCVGIGGAQTGIYPVESPGGWRLVARTPARLFDAASEAPFLLAAGDHVRFEPVTPAEFERLSAAAAAGTWRPRIEEPAPPPRPPRPRRGGGR
jgi:inhibitor of KinA